jgi:hypothetical protein
VSLLPLLRLPSFAILQILENYIVFGREVGEEETPHLQGYVQLKKKLRFNQAKAQLGVGNRPHLKVQRGGLIKQQSIARRMASLESMEL